jgi:hypothetical protein
MLTYSQELLYSEEELPAREKFKQYIHSELEEMNKITFELVDKIKVKMNGKNKTASIVTAIDYYYNDWLRRNLKGFKIDGMYYMFYEVQFIDLFNHENDDNSFMCHLFHIDALKERSHVYPAWVVKPTNINEKTYLRFYEIDIIPNKKNGVKITERYIFKIEI